MGNVAQVIEENVYGVITASSNDVPEGKKNGKRTFEDKEGKVDREICVCFKSRG